MNTRFSALRRALAITILAGLALPGASGAAEDLKGPIRIIVGYSPGNSGDTIARILAEKMTASLGTSVYVENKVGAGSRIAVDALKHAAPDGKTL
ncbi:MAG TPA: tripartite tricarboxylate transporter substrate-binding protein, partial [Bordetella sp.]|nr:tripartite tricarboxylate transporter substrate-binding protein [Bordetella sp.]